MEQVLGRLVGCLKHDPPPPRVVPVEFDSPGNHLVVEVTLYGAFLLILYGFSLFSLILYGAILSSKRRR